VCVCVSIKLPTVVQVARGGARSRKVAGSIPDGVMGIFIDNLSGRTIILRSTQLLTEMSTRNISWG
jgi:hypothetical protein